MKKIISKILIIFIIMIILFEFSFSSNVSYAFDSEDINSITNLVGGLVAFVLWIPRLLVTGISWLMGTLLTVELAESCGISDAAIFQGTDGDCATPFDIFFNKYTFFDVNFFDFTAGDSIIKTVREDVAEWFYILRTISAAILLVILIYVGIRMAISTIAEDKAKYKKMFWDWCCSLALIFVLQYIAIFVIETNNVIVNFLRDYGYNDIDEAIGDIMGEAMGPMGIGSLISTIVYCMIIFQTIAFMLVYIKRMIKVGFLIVISPMISITYSIDKMGDGKAQALNKWLKEFVYTILIQPFHCIMYLAFVNTAMKLLSTGATISDVMDEGLWEAIGDMNQLANGFLAILCLKFINDGEKAIRKIFNFQDDGNMTSLAAGAAIGMAAISSAQKIGKTTAKGITMAKNIPTRFNNAFGKDGEKGAFGNVGKHFDKAGQSFKQAGEAFKQTKIGGALAKAGGAIGKGANFVGDKAGKLGNAVANSKVGKFAAMKGRFIGGKITNAGRFVGGSAKRLKATVGAYGSKFANDHKGLMKGIKGAKTLGKNTLRKSMPIALGMMGMAMSYSTGSSGVMEAIGVGSGLQRGSEEFLASSQETIEGNVQDNLNEDVQDKKEVQDAQRELNDNANDITKTNDELQETNNTIANLSDKDYAMYSLLEEEQRLKNKRMTLASDLDAGRISQDAYDKQIKSITEKEGDLADRRSNYEAKNPEAFSKMQKLFDDKNKLQETLKQQTAQREALIAKAQQARKEAANLMIKQYKNNGSESQIARARSEISKAVQKCMMERKYQDSQGDISADYTLSDKETRSAERMQESICALLDKAVVSGGGRLDSGEVFKRFFGRDDDSPMARSLKEAIDDYQFQARAKNYNDNEELYKGTGGEKEKFREDVSTKASKHG